MGPGCLEKQAGQRERKGHNGEGKPGDRRSAVPRLGKGWIPRGGGCVVVGRVVWDAL